MLKLLFSLMLCSGCCFAGGKLEVCKITLGSEVKDDGIDKYFLTNWHLLWFSPSVEATTAQDRINPKRLQRDIQKQHSDKGVGTKSQQGLKRQQEKVKSVKKSKKKEKKQLGSNISLSFGKRNVKKSLRVGDATDKLPNTLLP